MADGNFKDLDRTATDKVSRVQAFNSAKNWKYDAYEVEKRNGQLPFLDNISDADLADIQSIRKCNKGFRFSLCVIDIYRKYACVIPLKDKKGITITNAFQKFLDESNRTPNEYGWINIVNFTIDQWNHFCRTMKEMKENLLLLKDLLEP